MSLAVFYLVRGENGDFAPVNAFFDTWNAHPPGIDCKLILLSKGWTDGGSNSLLSSLAIKYDADIVNLPDDGFDLGAYMRAAKAVKYDWVCFLNMHSQILVDGWLNLLYTAASGKCVGAAGATGCWGGRPSMRYVKLEYLHLIETDGLIYAALNAARSFFRLLCRYLFRDRHFPHFPNPNLRTNAFIMRRNLFVDFANLHEIPKTKEDAYRLESGFKSLTRFLLDRELAVIVVASDGKFYEPNNWMKSGTFRVPLQTGLLVSDNQTRGYMNADVRGRGILEIAAWGRKIDFPLG
jgi:hypothetical protein